MLLILLSSRGDPAPTDETRGHPGLPGGADQLGSAEVLPVTMVTRITGVPAAEVQPLTTRMIPDDQPGVKVEEMDRAGVVVTAMVVAGVNA